MSDLFTPSSEGQVTRLLEAYPLCWLVSGGAGERFATPLPLLAETNEVGAIGALFGHFGKSNPQVAALERDPLATILCMGPNGYISPRLVSKPGWGPTWNYAVARFEVDVAFVPEENDAALAQLAAALEQGADEPWTPAEMGPRYEQLSKHIIAFRATVRSAHPRFKLGQDEDDATFVEIVAKLADKGLAEWMSASRE